MSRSCGCKGMAGAVIDWSGSASSIYANAINYLGDNWASDLGVSSFDHAYKIIAKYKYYLSRGNIQDTPGGRQYISKIIADDLAKDTGAATRYGTSPSYEPSVIFNIIQNAAAALRRKQDSALPNPAVKAGLVSRSGGTWADVKEKTSDFIEKEKDNLKNVFTIPTWVKWTAGGLFGAAVFAGIKTRIGGR